MNRALVFLPDQRLEALAAKEGSKKVVKLQCEFVDIAGLVSHVIAHHRTSSHIIAHPSSHIIARHRTSSHIIAYHRISSHIIIGVR
eukprot:g66525.t1